MDAPSRANRCLLWSMRASGISCDNSGKVEAQAGCPGLRKMVGLLVGLIGMVSIKCLFIN